MSEQPLSSLCLACGLCCDGTLFTQVPLGPDELASADRHHLPVVTRSDGTLALRQRCGALTGTRCDIYDERPATCRSFRCMLHIALASDEVSLPEALATVAQAHAHLTALGALLPPAPEATMQRARKALHDPDLPPPTRAAIDRTANHLARHFHRGAR